MTISSFEIKSESYNIPCKLFEPDETPELIVIGVHGFAGDKESSVLFALAKELCEKGSALICFDFPAHGQSRAKDCELLVSNCKSDLASVIEFVKDKFPKSLYGIFATSFGGYIALLSIRSLSDFSIVLRAPAVKMDKIFLEKIIPVPQEEFINNGGVECGFERKMFVSAKFYNELINNPVNTISKPLMIIHGTKDDIVSYQDILEFCKRNENVTLISIENADHRFKNEGESEQIVKNAMQWYFN